MFQSSGMDGGSYVSGVGDSLGSNLRSACHSPPEGPRRVAVTTEALMPVRRHDSSERPASASPGRLGLGDFVSSTSHFPIALLRTFLSLKTRTKAFRQRQKCWVRGCVWLHGSRFIQTDRTSNPESALPFSPHPCQRWAFSSDNSFLI